MNSVDELRRWMADYSRQLKMVKMPGALPESTRKEFNKFMVCYQSSLLYVPSALFVAVVGRLCQIQNALAHAISNLLNRSISLLSLRLFTGSRLCGLLPQHSQWGSNIVAVLYRCCRPWWPGWPFERSKLQFFLFYCHYFTIETCENIDMVSESRGVNLLTPIVDIWVQL